MAKRYSPGVIRGVRLYNRTPDLVDNDAAHAFVAQLITELDNGYGLIPFIGAGLSAPSGAPLVIDIKSYLERCMGLALGVEEKGTIPWNPRSDQWPPYIDRCRATQDTDWWTKITVAYNERRIEPWNREAAVFQEALGAMAEWRTALLFLSRLVREQHGTGRDLRATLALDAPNQEVIDAGIREIMKGRRPTLGHRMLAELAVVLRLDIILTTNFDDLLEQAFISARNPLTVFEIHLNSTLPPWSALSTQRSLVKLHGNRHSLRADYSLDALPSEADRRAFLDYLVSADGRQVLHSLPMRAHPMGLLPCQNHLLVLGASAADRRTRAFIEYAWTHLSNDFKVIWVCHSVQDVKNVRSFTRDIQQRHRFDETWEGSRVLRFPNLGLLFLQIFQTARRALPTSGILFPSVSRLALPPMPKCNLAKGEAPPTSWADLRKRVLDRLNGVCRPDFHAARLIVVSSAAAVHGVTSVCAEIHEQLQADGDICLWLDMNDITSTGNLFEQLLDAANYHVGVESWMPISGAENARLKAAEIRRVSAATDRRWILFLNARETPGANVEEYSRLSRGNRPNNWIDDEAAGELSSSDNARSDDGFVDFLAALCSTGAGNEPHPGGHVRDSPPIVVVLLCREIVHDNDEPKPSSVVDSLIAKSLLDFPERLTATSNSNVEDRIVIDTLNWISRDEHDRPARRRFLHALVLSQRTRFLAAIWNIAAVDAADRELGVSGPAMAKYLQWTDELEQTGLVRRKPGGFIWCHSRPRNRLRAIFENYNSRRKFVSQHRLSPEIFRGWNPQNDESAIESELAQWYRRVLEASNAPAALFEAIYHACRAAEARLGLLNDTKRFTHASERIRWAADLLYSHSFLVQTQGHSRGSCRQLAYIRSILCDAIDAKAFQSDRQSRSVRSATLGLRIRCTEVMRAIAREVGADGRAFQRQRELRALFAGRKISDADRTTTEHLRSRLLDRPTAVVREAMRDLPTCWLRWWRWNGMLGIASRSYNSAQSALLRAFDSVVIPPPSSATSMPKEAGAERSYSTIATQLSNMGDAFRRGEWTVCGKRADSGHVKLEVLRIVEQLIANQLQLSGLARVTPDVSWPFGATDELEKVIVSGLRFAENLLTAGRSVGVGEVMWCRSRLLMHRSICHAKRRSWDAAMSLLVDAEASLAIFDSRRLGTDHAVIDLHRAEVQLLKATAIHLDSNRTFKDLSDCFVLNASDSLVWQDKGNAMRSAHLTANLRQMEKLERGMRQAKATVQDALRFFTRAEEQLSSRRRNVRWTTWYFQRKLSAIAMCIWATVHEQGTPIPFLGLEAAPRSTLTIADSLLEDAIRMIRVDPFRLARTIHEYADCARALHFRLMLDSAAPRLPERQSDMHGRLIRALARLNEVLGARTQWMELSGAGPRSMDGERLGNLAEDAQLDGAVGRYIEDTRDKCAEVARQLEYPLTLDAHVSATSIPKGKTAF